MITTSANWKAYTNVCGLFHIQATMNNGTSLSLTDEDFMDGSVTITDSISGMSSFNIGSVVTNTFSGTLNNFSGKFDNYKLAGATLTVSLGINYDDGVGVMGAEYNTSTSYVAGDYCSRNGHVYVCTGSTSGTWNSSKWTQLTTEYISRGVYTVDKPTSLGKTIKITAYDQMDKLNKYYIGKYTSGGTNVDVAFPITASTFVKGLCDYCGVPYVSGSMWKLGSFTISRFDYNESTTCRQVISWILQVAGGFARMNPSGKLECKPFNPGVWSGGTTLNGGTISPWSSVSTYSGGTISPWSTATVYDGGITNGYEYALERLTSLDVFTEDIEITGIRAYAYNTLDEFKFYTVGTNGYVIGLQGNPMITEASMWSVANRVADNVLGLNFRPFSATLVGDPSIEANDVIIMNDYLGNPHRSLITSITYALNKQERIECNAESPEANATEVANTSTATAMGAVTAAYDYIQANKISADYIDAGTIEAAVIATNFSLQGGSINVSTANETDDVIDLKYTGQAGDYELYLCPGVISIEYTPPNNDAWFEVKRGNANYLMLRMYDSYSNSSYIDTNGTAYFTGNVTAAGFVNSSRADEKRDIEKADSALDKVLNADILTFNFNREEKDAKKHIGLAIGGKYNTPSEVIAEDENGNASGVDLYAMVSMAWKAIQEQNAKIEALEKRVAELEKESK